MQPFKCTLCKKCCQNTAYQTVKASDRIDKSTGPVYVANYGFPINRTEVNILQEEAKRLGISLDVRPGLIAYDEKRNETVILVYSLFYEKCPFLADDGLCKVYEKRPLICRSFPANNYTGQFEFASKIGVPRMLKTERLCPEDKFYEEAGDKLIVNMTEKNFHRQLYEYFGESYIDAQVYQTHADFLKRIIKLLREKNLFDACSGKYFDEFKDRIDWKSAEYIADFVAKKGLKLKQPLAEYFEKFNHDKIKTILQQQLGIM